MSSLVTTADVYMDLHVFSLPLTPPICASILWRSLLKSDGHKFIIKRLAQIQHIDLFTAHDIPVGTPPRQRKRCKLTQQTRARF